MLDAIALYFVYRSSHVTSLRIVTTDLNLLSCTSRKGKTDSDLIRNAVLLWTTLFSVWSSSAKEFDFDFCVSTQSSVLFWSRLITCSFRVSLLIRHINIHCKGTIQLLHIYTSVWCSKSIDFSLYQIDVHASQSHTLWRHNTVFAHIHRMTATSLRIRCNSYTSHTHTLRRHDSAFAHLHAHVMQ